MDKLWAPWRAPYITKLGRKKSKGCIFCNALKEHRKNKKTSRVVEVTKHSFSVLNIYPYNNGHLMIAPHRHEGSFVKMKPEELRDMMQLLQKTQSSLERVLKPDSFNIGMNLGREAGAGIVDHLHFHIVPRWNGDTNFMPLFAETKILSQSLEAVREGLLNDIQKRNRRKRK